MIEHPSFEFTGPAEAPAIVFSHALGGDRSMWDRQLPVMAGSYRVIRYDLRGHGRSPASSGPLSLEDLALDVLRLLDDQEIDRAHFCGLSLGGLVGQWLGLHAQNRLRTLTLADTAPRMGSAETWNARMEQIERDGMSSISAATMNRWFTEGFRQEQPGVVAHFQTVLEATSPDGYISCAKVVRDASEPDCDLERFGAIQVPALIITGQFDSAATPTECQALASHIPGSRYVELNAAHISPVEASDAFSATLLAFLDSQPR